MPNNKAVAKIPRPQWLKTGLVMAGGWEPALFMVRCGQGGREFVSNYIKRYSAASLRRLKAGGVNFIILNFFKGAGLTAEKRDMERAIRTAKLAHKAGLKVGVYLGDTILFEAFIPEYPEARNWTQVALDGKPVWYNDDQTFRRRWCRNNPAYAKFMKEIIQLAIERADADLIHMDNYMHRAEPQACHCPVCQAQFREFIAKKYSPAQRVERFGFETLTEVIPPEYGRHEGASALDIIQNPLIQEWIDFRAQRNAEVYAELASFAHSLKSGVAFECNPGGIWGHNSAWQLAVDHERLLRAGEAFWNEEFHHPGLNEKGVVVSRVRTMKVARKMDQAMFNYTFNGRTDNETELMLAESLAFNQGNLNYVTSMTGATLNVPLIQKYIKFLKKHRGLYQNTVSCARIGVVRSYASLAYNSIDTHMAVLSIEQLLLVKRIPFDIIFESHLQSAGKDYDILILPNTESMADEHVRAVREFVKAGGSVLATDSASLYNEHRWRRKDFGLRDVFGMTCPKNIPHGLSKSMRRFGRGRCVYLPEIVMPTPRKMGNQNWFWGYHILSPWMHPEYWSLPKNAEEILQCLNWLEQDRWIARMDAPKGVFAEYLGQPETGRFLVHIVNYAAHNEIVDIALQINKKVLPKIHNVRTLSPNRMTTRVQADTSGSKDILRICLQADRVYTIVCLEADYKKYRRR